MRMSTAEQVRYEKPFGVFGRCVRPTIGARGASTYTVLGFVGYTVASVVCAVLAVCWELSLDERLVALVGPPAAFLAVVSIATAIKGREWIVFYQGAVGAVVVVAAAGIAIDGRILRLVDVAVIGIGTFLVFGRIGCLAVACCHGRPARRGVVYGAAHVAVGLWRRCAGRPLVPIQLFESAGSLILVACAVAASAHPGDAAVVYASGYGVLRFTLELHRGDPVRAYRGGLSEAQWWSIAVLVMAAAAHPSWWTLATLATVAVYAPRLVAHRKRRALWLPPHLAEIDRLCAAALADPVGGSFVSHLGVEVSCARLPDGRIDWILSSQHATWSPATAARMAALLWIDAEVVRGRTRGIVHVIVASPDESPLAEVPRLSNQRNFARI